MTNDYDALSEIFPPRPDFSPNGKHDPPKPKPAPRFTIGELQQLHPKLHDLVIDGLLRVREVANIISYSKIGKSWLVYYILLSVVTGRKLFGRYATTIGKALLVDNELHPATIAYRIRVTADAMGIAHESYRDRIEVLSLRGQLRDIYQFSVDVGEIKHSEFCLVVIDAKYRMLSPGTSENDNAAEAQFYNRLDQYAEQTQAAFICIHHATKGGQAEKRVTDVGAGAGAQSRAADTHLVLREHEEEGTVVLEGVVRSFPPTEPLALKWVFPLWMTADDVDPSKLKGRLTEREVKQNTKDKEGMQAILDALSRGPLTKRKIREKTGFSDDRCDRLLPKLMADNRIAATDVNVGGNETKEYYLPPVSRGGGR